MTLLHRSLPELPIRSLDGYRASGGGTALETARQMEPWDLIELIRDAGLRGRGGAGFPTAVKWTTVRESGSELIATNVVVNAAEGEPSTFKDRALIRRDPYSVIEGALIAAHAVNARGIIVGLKSVFEEELRCLHNALSEMESAGWLEGLEAELFTGPTVYLLGEETALLESIDGRPPFPRIAPPFRRGTTDLVESPNDVRRGSGLSAHVEMAGSSSGAPALVDNVETLVNVTRIVSNGPSWFRCLGTDKSPGSIVCTVTGDVVAASVGEVAMGTPLIEAISAISGGLAEGHSIQAVLPGVSNAVITATNLETPLTYEDMRSIGSGLGSGSFTVFDERADMAAVAAGASRFLYVESCGQCTPCKQNGAGISDALDRIIDNIGNSRDLDQIHSWLDSIDRGARCALAGQHQTVVSSILDAFPDWIDLHLRGEVAPTTRRLISELVNLDAQGATLDEKFPTRNPDWSYDHLDSGRPPAERLMHDAV